MRGKLEGQGHGYPSEESRRKGVFLSSIPKSYWSGQGIPCIGPQKGFWT